MGKGYPRKPKVKNLVHFPLILFIVPLVFSAVVIRHLPEEFVGQSPCCLSQTSLQILTVQPDHVKVLNAGQTHDLTGQISVSVNVLKRQKKFFFTCFLPYLRDQIQSYCTMYYYHGKIKKKFILVVQCTCTAILERIYLLFDIQQMCGHI